MPSNARWRRFKIVENLNSQLVNSQPNRGNEIVGGLKNALERGESLEKAKQSFINAGYRSDEVEFALNQVPQVASKISKALPVNDAAIPKKKLFGKSKVAFASVQDDNAAPASNLKNVSTNKSPVSKSKEKVSLGLIVALIIMGILVLGGAAYLGLNWEQFF